MIFISDLIVFQSKLLEILKCDDSMLFVKLNNILLINQNIGTRRAFVLWELTSDILNQENNKHDKEQMIKNR